MSFTLSITQEDIDQGHAGSIHRCPVCIALKRTLSLERLEDITVGETFTLIYPKSNRYQLAVRPFSNNKAVQEFIRLFDAGKEVNETEFELNWDIPKEWYAVPST